jgi:hypothetical protein
MSHTNNDFRKFIIGLPDNYLTCRARGYHTLGAYAVDHGLKLGLPCYLETEVCEVCDTRRTRAINKHNGFRVGEASYVHPKGYAAVGFGFRSKEDIGLCRLERAKRHLRRVA